SDHPPTVGGRHSRGPDLALLDRRLVGSVAEQRARGVERALRYFLAGQSLRQDLAGLLAQVIIDLLTELRSRANLSASPAELAHVLNASVRQAEATVNGSLRASLAASVRR